MSINPSEVTALISPVVDPYESEPTAHPTYRHPRRISLEEMPLGFTCTEETCIRNTADVASLLFCVLGGLSLGASWFTLFCRCWNVSKLTAVAGCGLLFDGGVMCIVTKCVEKCDSRERSDTPPSL